MPVRQEDAQGLGSCLSQKLQDGLQLKRSCGLFVFPCESGISCLQTHIPAHACAHTYIPVCTHMPVFTHACTHTHTLIHTHIQTHLHTHMHTCVHTYTCIHTAAYIYTCQHTCTTSNLVTLGRQLWVKIQPFTSCYLAERNASFLRVHFLRNGIRLVPQSFQAVSENGRAA